MDYYQLLSVKRDSELRAIHAAFRNLSKRMHPDRLPEADRPKAEKEYQQIVKAYNTLKDARLRKRYDESLERNNKPKESNSEEQFQKYYKAGLSRYQHRQYDQAAEMFKRAVFHKPHADSYYYKGMAESKLPGKRKEAVESLQKASEIDQYNAKILKALAKLLFDYGLKARARNTVERALEILPDDRLLLQIQAELEPEKARKKSGILGSIWGKFKGDDS